jgi:glycosyltransferase involved in cell wall biosynthesis
LKPKKKVLIITYYWPPGGGAGVQRWLKFVKYFPEYDWQPIVYCPEDGEMPVIDHSLERDIPSEAIIIRQKIWEPYNLYKKFTGRGGEKINTGFLSKQKKRGFTEKIAVWLRGNFFIPDARRFWISPSIKYLQNYLEENPVDAIVSTGPPHSMHLIALGLKKKTGIPWVADFRDPWTNIDYYPDLMLTKAADKKHHRLELEVIKTADAVVCIGKTMADEFEKIGNRKIDVITNGYDSDDLDSKQVQAITGSFKDLHFSIAHIGTMVKSRNPVKLWNVLKKLKETDSDFAAKLQIKIVGGIDYSVKESIEENQLASVTDYVSYVDHDEVIKFQKQSQILLLVLNDSKNAKGILTGKFFEYMASGRPVLCIGPEDGDAAIIINETGVGEVCNFNDEVKMTRIIMQWFSQFKNGNLNAHSHDIEKYSRKALTGQMVTLLDRISR